VPSPIAETLAVVLLAGTLVCAVVRPRGWPEAVFAVPAVGVLLLSGALPADQAGEFRAIWDEFEERKTPESRYAAAVDRFQPILLGCETGGVSWRQHGITQDRVLARNAHIVDGCAPLWDYAVRIIQKAVDEGSLAPAPR